MRQYLSCACLCQKFVRFLPPQTGKDYFKGEPVAATKSDAGAVGVAAVAWPLIDQMNPSAAALAAGVTEVDLATIQPGQQVIVKWRGHPLFVRRRTTAEIAASKAVDVASLPDALAHHDNQPTRAPPKSLREFRDS